MLNINIPSAYSRWNYFSVRGGLILESKEHGCNFSEKGQRNVEEGQSI